MPFYCRKEANSSSFVFFNGADISICLMLWVASALLLIGIYLRFVSGKRWPFRFSFPISMIFVHRFHHTSIISQLRRKTGMSTPLLPKWQRPSASTRPTVTTGGRGEGSSLRSKLVAYYFPAVDSSSEGFCMWSKWLRDPRTQYYQGPSPEAITRARRNIIPV